MQMYVRARLRRESAVVIRRGLRACKKLTTASLSRYDRRIVADGIG